MEALNGLSVVVQTTDPLGKWKSVAAFASFMDAGDFVAKARKDVKLRVGEIREGKLVILTSFITEVR